MPKLTRKTISEAMQSVPIESVLLGVSKSGERRLTAKQRKFAEQVALGRPAAKAYRETYDTKASPQNVGHQAHRLKADPKIAAQIDALRLAAEARKYATPAALRSLVIERLTAHAIDDAINPAQRLRALELLGKVTEVAAFTERREIIKTIDAAGAREALLESLRSALRATSIDAEIVDKTPGNRKATNRPRLTLDNDEISDVPGDPDAAANPGRADPTAQAPPASASASAQPLLSNPHIESPPSNVEPAATQTDQSTPVDKQG